MPYETYAYLRSLVESQQRKLETEFQISLDYIPCQVVGGNKESGRDKAHKIFSDRYAELNAVKEALHDAAAWTYKDHPNKKMREFWGITI